MKYPCKQIMKWIILTLAILFLLELIKYAFKPNNIKEGITAKGLGRAIVGGAKKVGGSIEDAAKKAKDSFESTGKQIGNTVITGSYDLYQQVSSAIGDAGIGELIKLYDAAKNMSFTAQKSLVEIGNINNRLNSLPTNKVPLTDQQIVNKFPGLGRKFF